MRSLFINVLVGFFYKLDNKVHSYVWLDEYSKKEDFARYWKEEWASGLTSWRKALKISDSDVDMVDMQGLLTSLIKIGFMWRGSPPFTIWYMQLQLGKNRQHVRACAKN